MSRIPVTRGFNLVYRPNEINRCPACAGAQWHIGRVTAECSYCHFPLAIHSSANGIGAIRHVHIRQHRSTSITAGDRKRKRNVTTLLLSAMVVALALRALY